MVPHETPNYARMRIKRKSLCLLMGVCLGLYGLWVVYSPNGYSRGSSALDKRVTETNGVGIMRGYWEALASRNGERSAQSERLDGFKFNRNQSGTLRNLTSPKRGSSGSNGTFNINGNNLKVKLSKQPRHGPGARKIPLQPIHELRVVGGGKVATDLRAPVQRHSDVALGNRGAWVDPSIKRYQQLNVESPHEHGRVIQLVSGMGPNAAVPQKHDVTSGNTGAWVGRGVERPNERVEPQVAAGADDTWNASVRPEDLLSWNKTFGALGPDADDILYGVDITENLQLLMNGSPWDPLPQFVNPCWMERLPPESRKDKNQSRDSQRDYHFADIPNPLGVPHDRERPRDNLMSLSKRANVGPRRANELFPYEQNHMFSFRFDPEFKKLQLTFTARKRKAEVSWRLRCLPAFYFIGVTKSGTTDFFHHLLLHPDIEKPISKEIHYWNQARYREQTRIYATWRHHGTLSEYLDFFDLAADKIYSSPKDKDNKYNKITGDGSISTLWADNGWYTVPGNQGLTEPLYTTPKALHALQPGVKLIVILREPADRIYSFYLMFKVGKASPEDFNLMAKQAVARYTSCIAQWGVRACAYCEPLEEGAWPLNIRGSLYSVFLRDWLEVFPRQQFLFIKAEDYFSDRMSTLSAAADFLGLDPFPEELHHAIQIDERKAANSGFRLMWNETRQILNDFFDPYNRDLERLLGRAMWQSRRTP